MSKGCVDFRGGNENGQGSELKTGSFRITCEWKESERGCRRALQLGLIPNYLLEETIHESWNLTGISLFGERVYV